MSANKNSESAGTERVYIHIYMYICIYLYNVYILSVSCRVTTEILRAACHLRATVYISAPKCVVARVHMRIYVCATKCSEVSGKKGTGVRNIVLLSACILADYSDCRHHPQLS